MPEPGCLLVGAIGLEPTTPTMSRWCSNQLSYAPEEDGILTETTIRFKFIHRALGRVDVSHR